MSSYLSLTQLQTLPVQRVTDVVTEFVQNVALLPAHRLEVVRATHQLRWDHSFFMGHSVLLFSRVYRIFGSLCFVLSLAFCIYHVLYTAFVVINFIIMAVTT